MNCQWEKLLSILPPAIRSEVDRQGCRTLLELRLRLGAAPRLCFHGKYASLTKIVTEEDIAFVVNTASRYSPWAAESIAKGYLTAPGGHRIGLAGRCVVRNGVVTGIRDVQSLCIRVARDFPGIGTSAPQGGSILILGPPGAGKTTLLRDLIRLRSNSGQAVAVVDEREELFPAGFLRGNNMDVLTGCGKREGIDMALRTLGPECIAVDEITSAEDCDGLQQAGWCGVDLIATAHAASCQDLFKRKIYQPLMQKSLFSHVLVLSADKSWKRMEVTSCISS